MFLLILIAFVLFLIGYAMFANKIKGLPPGPPPLPIIGNFYLFESVMEKKMLGWKKKYGRVFTLWLPQPTIVIGDAKLLQETIVRDGDNYGNRVIPIEMMKLLVDGPYGLVFNDNSVWKEQRRFTLHALRDVGFGSARVQENISNFAHEVVDLWKKDEGKPVDVGVNIMGAVANVVWDITFGKTLSIGDPLIKNVRAIFDELIPLFSHPMVQGMEILPAIRYLDGVTGSAIKRFVDQNNLVLDILHKEVAEVEAGMPEDSSHPQSYVEAYLHEIKKREKNGENMDSFTRHQLTIAAYDLWSAGFETTVLTLRFGINYLVNFPDLQRKMREEIQRVIGERIIRSDDQKNLPYCNAVLQELQRVVNVLPFNFFREIGKDTVIDGYTVKAGTAVLPQFQMVHTNPEEFERPDYFCPERHINEKGEFVKDDRVTPFSIGKRSCLGETLARLELFLFLTTFVQKLRFEPTGLIPPKPEFTLGFALSLKPYNVKITAVR